jgi:DNA-binding LytR/AlgR family response regulator
MEHSEAPRCLAGHRVLIVEDSFVLAEELTDMLQQLGGEPVGPAGSLREAVEVATAGELQIDAALLDINLRGKFVFPLAAALKFASIPFAFTTGYTESSIPESWRDCPRLEKPYTLESLRATIESLVTDAPPADAAKQARALDSFFATSATMTSPKAEDEEDRRAREVRMEEHVLRKWDGVVSD